MTDTNQEVRETPELLPCPFCGSAVELRPSQKQRLHQFVCLNSTSTCAGSGLYQCCLAENEASAIEAWNTRAALSSAPPPAVPDAVGVRATKLRDLRWTYMPSYGGLSFDQLREAVSQANIGDRYHLGPFDPTYSAGHQQIGGCNYNSLNRIVTAFVQAALSSIEPTPSPEPQASNAGADLREALLKLGSEIEPTHGEGARALIDAAVAALSTPDPQTGERDGEVEGFLWRNGRDGPHDAGPWVLTDAIPKNIGDRVEVEPLVRQSALLAERTAREAAEVREKEAVEACQENASAWVDEKKRAEAAERRLAEVEERAREDARRIADVEGRLKAALENVEYRPGDYPLIGLKQSIFLEDVKETLAALRAKPEAHTLVGKENGDA